MGEDEGAPQLPISTPALRHLRPGLRAGPRQARFPPGPTGYLVFQGVQVPPADGPGPRLQDLLHFRLLPWLCRWRRPASRVLRLGLQPVSSQCCSWGPEENRADLKISCL